MKSYSCSKCPGYCCSYPEIEITKRDVSQLAKHFGITEEQAAGTISDKKEALRLAKRLIDPSD